MKLERYILVVAMTLLSREIFAEEYSWKTGEINRQNDHQNGESGQDQPHREASQSRQPYHASEILGLGVHNAAGEQLGSIEDLIVDLRLGKISYAVVASSRTLGTGGKLFAVPIDRLAYVPGDNEVTLNIDRQVLAAGPTFTWNHEPNWADTTWTVQVDRYYRDSERLTPTGRNENTAGNPDRTGLSPPEAVNNDNIRWNNSQSVNFADPDTRPTTGDRSSSKDLEISRQVRKGFSRSSVLALAAMDVQITARDGQVILSGTVDTEDQRDHLLDRASLVVGSSRVIDQIEVIDNKDK